MRVFVTGGTGFIGSRVVERLARRGHATRCLVRPSTNVSALSEPGAEIVRGDLRDRDTVRLAVDGCDALVHLAAAYDFWLPDRRAVRDVNVTGTRDVMEAALDAGVRLVCAKRMVPSAGSKHRATTQPSCVNVCSISAIHRRSLPGLVTL